MGGDLKFYFYVFVMPVYLQTRACCRKYATAPPGVTLFGRSQNSGTIERKKSASSLYPALLKMYFRMRLCPQHISNQTDAHDSTPVEIPEQYAGLKTGTKMVTSETIHNVDVICFYTETELYMCYQD